MLKNIYSKRYYTLLSFLILVFYQNSFSQITIEEKIEIDPGKIQSITDGQRNGIWFLGCYYDLYDSTELDMRFTPENIEPGEETIMQLWLGQNQYNEDGKDIVERTVTVEPSGYGEIVKTGNGKYLFTASDTITVDPVAVTISYENYSRFCWNRPPPQGNKIGDCLDCFPNAPGLKRVYRTEVLILKRDSLDVLISPSEIFAGDTAEVIIKKRLQNGTLVDFDSTQTFEVGMLEGCALGTLLVGTSQDTGNYFYNINNPIKFVAADSLEGDSSGVVKLRVGLVEQTLLKRKNKETDKINDYCFIGSFQSENTEDADVEVEKEPEILLGQIKYYAVKKKTENGSVTKIKIDEIKVEQNIIPTFPSNLSQGWSWIQDSTIWSSRPINIETHGQSPIFYDKFYAQVYYTGTTKPVIHDLPEGMIRVIGRYLGKTPDNKVKLFTTEYQSSFTDTLEIQVVRPDKLGDNILSVTGPTRVDNVDSTYNIDSLVIDIAGDLGVPPQFLMGIVQQESPNGLGYRYEPFSDMFTVQKKFDSNHRYWIESETDLGDPTIPHHNNIEDARGPLNNYPGYITVWDIFNEKNAGSGPKMYTLNVYKHIKKDHWLPYKKNHFKSLQNAGLDSLVAEDSSKILADTSYIRFLKDSIGGKGMHGTVAQTRIAASYGLMQLTYFSGVKLYADKGYNYPNNDANFLPEYAMIPPVNILYGSKHLLGKLRDKLGSVYYLVEDTWPKDQAFELSYWKAFLGYNGGSNLEYPNSVFNHVKNNLPKKD